MAIGIGIGGLPPTHGTVTQSFAPGGAVYGTIIPLTCGQRAITGVPIACGPFEVVYNDIMGAGGGAGSIPTQGYTITMTYFAVAFGKSLIPIASRGGLTIKRLWANGALIYDVTNPAAASTSPNLDFSLYVGDISQVADPTIVANATDGTLIGGNRDMIYVVFRNFQTAGNNATNGTGHINTVGTGGNPEQIPTIRAEFLDSIGVTNSRIDFTKLANVGNEGTIFDWRSNTAYGWNGTAGGLGSLHNYSIAAQAESVVLPVSGTVTPGPATGGTNLGGVDNCDVVFDPNANLIFTAADAITNCMPIVAVNATTAAIVSQFGESNSSLVPNNDTGAHTDGIPFPKIMDITQGGGSGNLLLIGSFNGYLTALAYDTAGTFTWLNEFTQYASLQTFVVWPANQTAQAATVPANSAQDGAVFIGDGSAFKVAYLSGSNGATLGAKTIHDFGGTYSVKQILCCPWDNSVIAFAQDNSGATLARKYGIKSNTQTFGTPNAVLGSSQWHGLFPDVNANPLYEVSVPAINGGPEMRRGFRNSNTTFGTMAWPSGSGVGVMDLATGNSHTDTFAVTLASRDWAFDSTTSGMYFPDGGGSNTLSVIFVDQIGSLPITIGEVLTWICLKAGYALGDISVDAGLTDPVEGVNIAQRYDLATLFGDLGEAYNFLYFESEGKAKFVRTASGTGAPGSTFVFTRDNMAAIAEGGGNDVTEVLMTTIDQPSSVPRSTVLNYIDPGADYSWESQTFASDLQSSNTATTASGTNSLTIPIVMSASEAYTRASEVQLLQAQTSVTQTFRLPAKFMRLEPSDAVTIQIPPYSYVVRVDEVDFNADWSLSCFGNNYSFNNNLAVTSPGYLGLVPQRLPGLSDSKAVALDVPLLAGGLDVGQASIVLMTGVESYGQANWGSAQLFYAPDGTSLTVQYSTDKQTPYGVTPAALPVTDTPFQTDTTTTLTVTLQGGTSAMFATCTDDEFLAGANGVLVGANGRWEYIFFRDVTVVSTRQVVLSHLTRGRRGTDGNCNSHAAGDTVILASSTATGFAGPLHQFVLGDAVIGTPQDFAAVGVSTQSAPATIAVVPVGNSLKPWAPSHVAGSVSGSDVVFTWDRRDRVFSVLHDGDGDTPLNEAFEKYDVEVLDAPGGSVVRTFTDLTAATVTYTAAEQATDGFTAPVEVATLRVYQKSAVVGRGFTRESAVWVTG